MPSASYAEQVLGAIEPLPTILTDDGGLDLNTSLSWIDEGLSMLEQVESHAKQNCEWYREEWGAHIFTDRVVIAYLHDDELREIVPTPVFKKVLSSWRNFVAAGPAGAPTEELEIGGHMVLTSYSTKISSAPNGQEQTELVDSIYSPCS